MTKPTLEQQIQWLRDFADDVEKCGSYELAIEGWELSSRKSFDEACRLCPSDNFFDDDWYRRKPQTRIINGFEVPAPVPKDRLQPFRNLWGLGVVCGSPVDELNTWSPVGRTNLLKNGFVFYSKLDALKNLYALRGEDPATAPCDE